MEIAGFLGTRADLIIDVVMTVSGFLPAFMLYAFYVAAKGRLELHKKLQITALVVVTFLVLALEVDVRFGNLSEVSAQSSYHDSMELTVLFIIHLIFSITTFVGWIWLVVKSYKIYPDTFGSFNHKKWGKILFADIVLTVITGWMMYAMVFIY